MAKDGMTVQYKYDHNGLRVAKIVNGVETRYILNGKQLTHLHRGNDWMHFFYDAQGRPVKVRYNGTIYSYILNLQGDIVGIIDIDGNVVVEYKYDAWGKLLSTIGSLAGSLGNLNPLRYRGYVYDEETGLYYLRSRYYNPEKTRFISADVILGVRGSLLSHNSYGYCGANPVMQEDPDGLLANGDVHNWVCEEIVARSGGKIKKRGYQKVQLQSGGYGLIDLIDISTGEIWEVKRVTCSAQRAMWQVGRYVAGAVHSGVKADSYSLGSADKIGFGIFYREGYFVAYAAAGNGYVLYDYFKVESLAVTAVVKLFEKIADKAKDYESQAKTVGAVIGAAAFAGAAGQSPGVGAMAQDLRLGTYEPWKQSFMFIH